MDLLTPPHPRRMRSRQDLLGKLAPWGKGGSSRGVGRRTGRIRKKEWVKDREGELGKRYLERGSQYGVSEKGNTRKFPGTHMDDIS